MGDDGFAFLRDDFREVGRALGPVYPRGQLGSVGGAEGNSQMSNL